MYIPPACNARDPSSIPGSGASPGEGIGYLLQYSWASLVAQTKEFTWNAGDLGSIPTLGRCPVGWHGNLLQCSCLENPQGQRSLVSCSPWGSEESDAAERLSTAQHGMCMYHTVCCQLHLWKTCGLISVFHNWK